MVWYKEKQNCDVVVSSRIRLARNLKNFPFMAVLNEQGRQSVINEVKATILNSNSTLRNDFDFIDLTNYGNINKVMLAEEHLISHDLAKTDASSGLLLSKDKNVSIMLCEEDHIRIQCIMSGLNIEKAYELADKIDDVIEESIDYAFSNEYGYLTSCPTNVGTGLRASVMLHLPAIVLTGNLNAVVQSINKLGMTVRGAYGEGSEGESNLFQISNQVTLGVDEKSTISKLANIVEQIASKERELRKLILNQSPDTVADKLWRSYGILKYARKLSAQEAKKLLSDVRLAIELGIIDNNATNINELIVEIEPAHIIDLAKRDVSADERDVLRAKVLREKI